VMWLEIVSVQARRPKRMFANAQWRNREVKKSHSPYKICADCY
jgi:hypothetical protein